MKKILILLALLIPFVMKSENYIKEGTKWNCEASDISTGKLITNYYSVTAEKSADDDCLMMVQSPYGEIDKKLMCYVKTEGEKVYFKPEKSETDDWYLLYDFGLKAGEGCYVYMINPIKDGVPHRTYVKCTGFNEYSGYYGMDTMTMEEYEDDSCLVRYGKGIWIKGLGSDQGPLDNNYFEATGAYSLLNEAYDGDKLVYLRNMTRFKEGTKWQMHTTPAIGLQGEDGTDIVTVAKSPNDDFFVMYLSENGAERQPVCYAKAEGDKVFFKPIDSKSSEWYLMYDFGINPGEWCYIYSPLRVDKNSIPRRGYVKCVDWNAKSSEYDGWETLSMEEYDESGLDIPIKYTWIVGLGSEYGVFNNGCYFVVGGGGSRLEKVYRNEYTIYESKTAAISKVKDSDSAGIRIDGRNLYVTTENAVPGAVYGIDGMNLGSYTFGNEPTQIELPGKGVYILKIGSESRKIMIP